MRSVFLTRKKQVEKKSDALDRKENSLKSREEELNKAKEKVEQLSEQQHTGTGENLWINL